MNEFFHFDAAIDEVTHKEKMERLKIREKKGRLAE